MHHDWCVQKSIVSLPVRLKGNFKRFSSNFFHPLGSLNKNINTALQTLLTWFRLHLCHRLLLLRPSVHPQVMPTHDNMSQAWLNVKSLSEIQTIDSNEDYIGVYETLVTITYRTFRTSLTWMIIFHPLIHFRVVYIIITFHMCI